MKKMQYTDKELQEFERLKDNLIIWMFHKPNDSYPILELIKEAFQLGVERKDEE